MSAAPAAAVYDAGLTTVDRLIEHQALAKIADLGTLARLGRAASARVEQCCGLTFAVRSYIEPIDGGGRCLLLLAQAPIVAVAWVKNDAASACPREILPSINGSPGYLVVGNMLALQGGARFSRGRGSVVVSYTAGFDPVPDDIEQAVVDLVALKVVQRDRVGLVSEAMAGQTTSYFTGAMPADVASVLQQYKRVAPV